MLGTWIRNAFLIQLTDVAWLAALFVSVVALKLSSRQSQHRLAVGLAWCGSFLNASLLSRATTGERRTGKFGGGSVAFRLRGPLFPANATPHESEGSGRGVPVLLLDRFDNTGTVVFECAYRISFIHWSL
jgi:hypothetical protein